MRFYILTLLMILSCAVRAQDNILKLRPELSWGRCFPDERYLITNAQHDLYYFYDNIRQANFYKRYSDRQKLNEIIVAPQYFFTLEYTFARRHTIGVGYGFTNVSKFITEIYIRDPTNLNPLYYRGLNSTMQAYKYSINYGYSIYYNDIQSSNNKFLNRLMATVGVNTGMIRISDTLGFFASLAKDYYHEYNRNSFFVEPYISLSILNRERNKERLCLRVSYERGNTRMQDIGFDVNYMDANGEIIKTKMGQINGVNQLKWSLSYPITLYDFNKKKKKPKKINVDE